MRLPEPQHMMGLRTMGKKGLDAYEFENMGNTTIERLKEFMDNEARSCSMDYGCITPQYVYRMWGGQVPIEEIETALKAIKKQ